MSPLLVTERWTFTCAVCSAVGELDSRPGGYAVVAELPDLDSGRAPANWRRITVRATRASARLEDWVCSSSCAIAFVSRSYQAAP